MVNLNDEILQVPMKVSRRAMHCIVDNMLSGDLIVVFLGSFHVCFESKDDSCSAAIGAVLLMLGNATYSACSLFAINDAWIST